MMDICEYYKCTGCAACVNACAHHCIQLLPDKYGELHPYVDNEKCLNCGLCQKVCPNNSSIEFRYPIRCMASWIDNEKKRKKCASGGIGTIMSEYVINNGGVVFGSRYEEDLHPIITYTEHLDELDYFKGSRYVQSVINKDTFKRVLDFLQKGKMVLFIGTPCQVAGLLTYLKKPYENLITVDLICHGVCPSSYLNEEINYLKTKYRLNNITDARFRGNDGNDFILTLWNSEGEKLYPRDTYLQKLFFDDISEQYYLTGFLLGVSMRENCYSCNYARPERISDITIGDFIGLGKTEPFKYSINNVSSVLLNTNKGESFYSLVSANTSELTNIERSYAERLEYKPSLVHAFERHPYNYSFREEYLKHGYAKAIRIVLKEHMKNRQKRMQREVPKLIIGKVSRVIKKIIRH